MSEEIQKGALPLESKPNRVFVVDETGTEPDVSIPQVAEKVTTEQVCENLNDHEPPVDEGVECMNCTAMTLSSDFETCQKCGVEGCGECLDFSTGEGLCDDCLAQDTVDGVGALANPFKCVEESDKANESQQSETTQIGPMNVTPLPNVEEEKEEKPVSQKKVKLKAFALRYLKMCGSGTTKEIATDYVNQGYSTKDIKKVQASLAVTFCNMLKDSNSGLKKIHRGVFGLVETE